MIAGKLVLVAALCLVISISMSGGEYSSSDHTPRQDTERQETNGICKLFIPYQYNDISNSDISFQSRCWGSSQAWSCLHCGCTYFLRVSGCQYVPVNNGWAFQTYIQHYHWSSSCIAALSLVESCWVLKYFHALKGPIIGALSDATPAVLCHKEPARRKNTP